MIYPKDFETKIGFKSLREVLAEKCESQMGKRLTQEMKFTSDFNLITRQLNTTREFRNLIESGSNLPSDTFFDIFDLIKEKQAPGSFLPADILYQCGVSFQSMNSISSFFKKEENEKKYVWLKEEFISMPDFDELGKEIFRCIEKGGEVRDNASEGLYAVRRELERVSKSMHAVMRRVIEQSVKQGLIEKDVSPAMRDGHMVLPVSAANKKSISGILHDTSATGKTFFIEPTEVVQAGNNLRALQIREEQEVIKVLVSLTSSLVPNIDEIGYGFSLLARYDFIRAKARFAIETGGEMPQLEKEPEIDWYHAVHPGLLILLQKQGREVVPLNLELNKERRILIISGPNAGGKSVTLKTAGTVQYMMQCGMLPTLYSNSHMGVFENIFIDIGDEQSMENDLSTYSSHLTNMKFFLTHAKKGSLILADEMGSGTEPQIGAALAQAVVRELGNTGCMGIITTHYQNLKVLADSEEGFINGAMLYDRQHLRPTYQLLTGQPGSSFALEIARNIGMPSVVIENAKEIVGSDYVDSEKFLLDIQRDRKYWKNKRLDIKEKENKLNKLLEEYEEKAKELKEQRLLILREAKEEARGIIAGANSQIEKSIHEIRKSQADREKSKAVRQELEDYKKSLASPDSQETIPEILKPLRHKSKNLKNQKSSEKNKSRENDFQTDSFVKMKDSKVVGKIISINGKKAEVAFGNLRMQVELKDLQPAEQPKNLKDTPVIVSATEPSGKSRERQLNFKQEIDVRGMRADEALQAVTYFIDDALQFNIPKVRILHGTGHGILRTLIRDYLNSSTNVKSFHDEDVRFGGAGITVVEMA